MKKELFKIKRETELSPKFRKELFIYFEIRNNVLCIYSPAKAYFYKIKETTLPSTFRVEKKHIPYFLKCLKEGTKPILPFEEVDAIIADEYFDMYYAKGIEIDADVVKTVSYAMAKDSVKPVFNGVCLYKPLGICASDSRRLSLVKMKLPIQENIILDYDLVKELKYNLEIFPYHAKADNLIMRFVDGSYPKIENVIPKDSDIYFEIKNVEKLKEYISILKDDIVKKIVFNKEKNKVEISHGVVDLEYETNADYAFAFNGQYLLDVFNSKGSRRFELNGSNAPGVSIKENRVDLVMPIQVKNV